MNQAKLALTAIAILAVVGGALAFKANIPRVFYKANPTGACDFQIMTKLDVTNASIPGAFTTALTLAPDADNPCPVITVKAGS